MPTKDKRFYAVSIDVRTKSVRERERKKWLVGEKVRGHTFRTGDCILKIVRVEVAYGENVA